MKPPAMPAQSMPSTEAIADIDAGIDTGNDAGAISDLTGPRFAGAENVDVADAEMGAEIHIEMAEKNELSKPAEPTEPIVPTWSTRVEISGPAVLFERLRASSLPLCDGSHQGAVPIADGVHDAGVGGSAGAGAENTSGSIVALVCVTTHGLSAVVATPSGLLYRFEPTYVESAWWAFAAQNYYVVTGNLADRVHLARLSGLSDDQAKATKGKVWLRRKDAELSGLDLDQLIDLVAPPPPPPMPALSEYVQSDLFCAT